MNGAPATAQFDLSQEYERLRRVRHAAGRHPQRVLVNRGVADWMRFAVDLLYVPLLSPRPVPELAAAIRVGTGAPEQTLPAECSGALASDLVGVLADVCLAALDRWTAGVGPERPQVRAPRAPGVTGLAGVTKEGSRGRVR